MSERRRKRRTQSAAEVEFAGQFVESSPLAQKTRRKSSARQARLVGFPVQQQMFSGMPLNSQVQMTMSQPVFNGVNYSQSQIVFPQPQWSNNSLIFTLIPQQSEIPYCVALDREHFPRATLKASGGVRTITFRLNGTLFTNAVPPLDISTLIAQGNNFFEFSTLGFQTPIFIEVLMEEVQDPDVLVDQVVNKFPAPPPIISDPFSTFVCPLSQKTMEKPARGVNCTHSQCFDLKTYITRGIKTNIWLCPICGMPVPFEDLRYDREYMKQPVVFGMSDGSDSSTLFSDMLDRKFDPFDTNLFMDRDF